MSDAELFSSEVIPESLRNIEGGYDLRPLAQGDYHKGYFQCLQGLTWTGDITEAQYLKHFDWMKTKGSDWLYNIVIEHSGCIVATGILIAERKL
jgi:glucosamine-phosphate N-acetyltransferase